jgi:anti-sigma factor RsiW
VETSNVLTCRELIEFLDDYVAGTLPPARLRRFEEHLQVCDDCVSYLDSYRKTIALEKRVYLAGQMDAPTPTDVPEGLLKAVLAARAIA